MATEIENAKILAALISGQLLKACVECAHYREDGNHSKCHRDRTTGFHNVTGKIQEYGEIHHCNIEREIDNQHPSLVANGSKCGAIAQFFEQAPDEPKVKIKWWQRSIRIVVE